MESSHGRTTDARIQKLAGGTQSQTSVGGMAAELKAARLANEAGIPMQIAHGLQKNVLVSICRVSPTAPPSIRDVAAVYDRRQFDKSFRGDVMHVSACLTRNLVDNSFTFNFLLPT